MKHILNSVAILVVALAALPTGAHARSYGSASHFSSHRHTFTMPRLGPTPSFRAVTTGSTTRVYSGGRMVGRSTSVGATTHYYGQGGRVVGRSFRR